MHAPADHAAPSDPTPTSSGRDARGRFTKGNAGGPGNPFARRTAALRKAFCEAFSEEDIRQMVEVIKLKALCGDLAACKLLLSYCVGRPAPVVEPDTLDVEEFKQYERELGLFNKVPDVIREFTPDVCCEIVRTARPEIVAAKGEQLGEILRTGRMPGDPEPENEPAPSGNGDNGASRSATPETTRPREREHATGARREARAVSRPAGVTAPSGNGGNGQGPREDHAARPHPPGPGAGRRTDPRPSGNGNIGGGRRGKT
jgi:hypothetical protein